VVHQSNPSCHHYDHIDRHNSPSNDHLHTAASEAAMVVEGVELGVAVEQVEQVELQ